MAGMLEDLELADGMRVLEIGTGTGYKAMAPKALFGYPPGVDTIGSREPQPGMPLNPEQKAVADRILAERVAKHGAPGLEHYRRVYASIELPWPGDEEIRRLYLVADAAFSK